MGGVESNMAIASLFMVSAIEEEHGKILRSYLKKNVSQHLSDLDHPHEVTRQSLDEAILLLPPSSDFKETDTKILEELFVLNDKRFTNTADYKDLLVSLTPLITGSVRDKLMYAFRIYDEDNTGGLTSGDLRKVLHCINTTAIYFGDPALTELNIKEIIHDIFLMSKVKTAPMQYDSFVDALVEHEIVLKFLGGWGNAKFGDCPKNS